MDKITDENFYVVQGWMIKRLGLKGIQKDLFAIIYAFSQDGESEFCGSLQYLSEFCGDVSKPTLIKALKELVDKEFLIKTENRINGVPFNRYKANLMVVKKFNSDMVKNFNLGSKEILPNNKDDNKDLLIIKNEKENIKKKKFEPPTLEQVMEYAKEKGREDLAQQFYDYFTTGNWIDSQGKQVLNWKQKFLTWCSKNAKNSEKPTEQPKENPFANMKFGDYV